MRKKRIIIDGFTYHVTSRTNNKIKAFESNVGQKLMLVALEEAKEKYNFILHNFCIMPTHIHLLITPANNTNLSDIMQRIKKHSANSWNLFFNSSGHLWGGRFFSRPIIGDHDFSEVYNYIEQNPVKAGYVSIPQEWNASGSFHKANGLISLITA